MASIAQLKELSAPSKTADQDDWGKFTKALATELVKRKSCGLADSKDVKKQAIEDSVNILTQIQAGRFGSKTIEDGNLVGDLASIVAPSASCKPEKFAALGAVTHHPVLAA
ncbi:MAG: hypothetical protein FJX34_05325 [Alphaproteobacteria bacterium]|nr:hypothetical protein [Alphaproteobacteria bacterium]